MTMQATTLRWALVGATAAVTAGLCGAYIHRERRMDEIYARATGGDTVEAQAAVRELSTYQGTRSTHMLLDLAEGKVPLPWPDVQAEAIRALASRQDPSIPIALANLLQPHVSLRVRGAAAEALGKLPCTAECVGAVLHYLERLWWGEPNSEDGTKPPENPRIQEFYRNAKAGLAREQDGVYQALYGVLKRENRLTLENLVQIYGLGTAGPSKFALALVARIRLNEACPAVLRSEESASRVSPELFILPREELEATARSLGCR